MASPPPEKPTVQDQDESSNNADGPDGQPTGIKTSSPAAKPRRQIPLRRKLIFALAPVIIILLVLEIGLRIAGYEYHPEDQMSVVASWEMDVWSSVIVPDRDLIYRFRPGAEDSSIDPAHRPESMAINSDGFRGDEFTVEKPSPDTTRIATIGDSVTFGVFYSKEGSYPYLLEQKLQARGNNVQVYNMALPSYTSSQNLWDFQLHGRKFKPDIVLLQFACWNDYTKPLNLLSDVEVRRNQWIRNTIVDRLDTFRIGNVINKYIEKYIYFKIKKARKEAESQADIAGKPDPNSEARRVTLAEFRHNLDEFLKMSRKDGFSLLVLVPAQPTETQESSGDIYKPYYDMLRSLPESDKLKIVEVQDIVDSQTQVAAEDGKTTGDMCFIDFTHYNELGNDVVSSALVGPIEELMEARHL